MYPIKKYVPKPDPVDEPQITDLCLPHSSQQSILWPMTCVGQVFLFTSYEGNLDNQLRCRHQPNTGLGLSTGFQCVGPGVLPCCHIAWLLQLWTRHMPHINRITLHGVFAFSCHTNTPWPWRHDALSACIGLLTDWLLWWFVGVHLNMYLLWKFLYKE